MALMRLIGLECLKASKLLCRSGFSYHRWADERDGVGKAAHDHLPSLRLKLTRTNDQLVPRFSPLGSGVLLAHHVVPHALGQLLVTLYGEVEAVVGEEAHVDLPVLLGHSGE